MTDKMTSNKNFFIAFLFIVIFSFEIKAQIGLSSNNSTNNYSLFLSKKYSQTFQNQRLSATAPPPLRKAPPSNINAPYYQFSVETMPFFCKIEYKMGLNKKLPVKFRLGDVQYVDELEGK